MKPVAQPNPQPTDFVRYMNEWPRGWGIWRMGQQLLPEYLGLLEHETRQQIDLAVGLDEAGGRARVWQDAMGLAVSWAHEYMHLTARPKQVQPHDVHALLRRLSAFGPVRDLLNGVHMGFYEFDTDRYDISLTMKLDAGQELVNRWLQERRERRSQVAARRVAEAADFSPWLRNVPPLGPRLPVPDWVHEKARENATLLVGSYVRLLPEQMEIGGFRLQDLWTLWVELVADAMVFTMAGSARQDPFDPLPSASRRSWVTGLSARTDVAAPAVEAIVDYLTYRHGFHIDPALAPLIPARGELVLLPSLVLSSSIERNVLRAAALDHAAFGPVGRELGALADRVVTRFETVRGLLLATRESGSGTAIARRGTSTS